MGWVVAGVLAIILLVAVAVIVMRSGTPAAAPVTVQVVNRPPPAKPSEMTAVKPENPPQYEKQTQEFQQIGILTSAQEGDREPMILPLYGKRFDRQERWVYYAASDKPFHLWRVPIQVDKRTCEEQPGCRELQTGDDVIVPIYAGRTFKANMYKPEAPQYFADRI